MEGNYALEMAVCCVLHYFPPLVVHPHCVISNSCAKNDRNGNAPLGGFSVDGCLGTVLVLSAKSSAKAA